MKLSFLKRKYFPFKKKIKKNKILKAQFKLLCFSDIGKLTARIEEEMARNKCSMRIM